MENVGIFFGHLVKFRAIGFNVPMAVCGPLLHFLALVRLDLDLAILVLATPLSIFQPIA
jgi:hypothetical protein